jgi:D-alanyl-D-alanine carboxypeptidase
MRRLRHPRVGPVRSFVAAGSVCLLALAACGSGESASGESASAPDTAPVPRPSGSGEAPDDRCTLAAVLDEWAAQNPVAASSPAAVGIAREGESSVVVAGGTSGGRPVTVDDWYRFGSVTKTYVATALLRLAERGVVDLDAPVGTYVDGVPGGAVLTARQLLSHTSGLADYLAQPAWAASVLADPGREWTARQALDLIPAAEPEPAGFEYSNTNYVVLGLILEEVTGLSVRDAVATEVLEPAGLSETDMSSEGHPVVGGLADLGDGTIVSTLDNPYTAMETSAGAAGSIVGSPSDLLRFGRALLDGRLLDDGSWEQMTDFGEDGVYGLGLGDLDVISGGDVVGWGNYGEIPGFGTLLVLEPSSGTVLVAVSGDDRASGFELGAALQRALADGGSRPSAGTGAAPAPSSGTAASCPSGDRG